jgi:hypothetical protein
MILDRMYILATGLILLGFVLLCQPLSQKLFSAGFPVLVFGVVMHLILDHWPKREAAQEEST